MRTCVRRKLRRWKRSIESVRECNARAGDPANPDLYLGKAYYAVGPLRIATNFFILERHRTGLTEYVRR